MVDSLCDFWLPWPPTTNKSKLFVTLEEMSSRHRRDWHSFILWKPQASVHNLTEIHRFSVLTKMVEKHDQRERHDTSVTSQTQTTSLIPTKAIQFSCPPNLAKKITQEDTVMYGSGVKFQDEANVCYNLYKLSQCDLLEIFECTCPTVECFSNFNTSCCSLRSLMSCLIQKEPINVLVQFEFLSFPLSSFLSHVWNCVSHISLKKILGTLGAAHRDASSCPI